LGTFLFAASVVAVAAVVRGATGFGFALLAAIGLSQVMPVATVTPLVLVIEMALTATILRDGGMAHLDIRRAAPLMAGGCIGVVLGFALFTALPAHALKIGLDAAIRVSAALALVNVRVPALDRTWIAVLVGALTGAVVAAFGVGGPIAVVWLLATGATPAYLRATVTAFFALIDGLSIVARLSAGAFPWEAFTGALWLTPVAVVGALIGGAIFRRLHPTHWRRGVAAFLVVAALFSLARSLLAG
jgi:uncharacterized membrane protein YfcA